MFFPRIILFPDQIKSLLWKRSRRYWFAVLFAFWCLCLFDRCHVCERLFLLVIRRKRCIIQFLSENPKETKSILTTILSKCFFTIDSRIFSHRTLSMKGPNILGLLSASFSNVHNFSHFPQSTSFILLFLIKYSQSIKTAK